jgi:hypothetical protein
MIEQVQAIRMGFAVYHHTHYPRVVWDIGLVCQNEVRFKYRRNPASREKNIDTVRCGSALGVRVG